MFLFKISQKTIQVGYESLFLLCAASKKLLKRCFYVRDREKVISVPKHQNPVLLIFGKNELEAFLESLRPPLSIACPTMAMASLQRPLIEAQSELNTVGPLIEVRLYNRGQVVNR